MNFKINKITATLNKINKLKGIKGSNKIKVQTKYNIARAAQEVIMTMTTGSEAQAIIFTPSGLYVDIQMILNLISSMETTDITKISDMNAILDLLMGTTVNTDIISEANGIVETQTDLISEFERILEANGNLNIITDILANSDIIKQANAVLTMNTLLFVGSNFIRDITSELLMNTEANAEAEKIYEAGSMGYNFMSLLMQVELIRELIEELTIISTQDITAGVISEADAEILITSTLENTAETIININSEIEILTEFIGLSELINNIEAGYQMNMTFEGLAKLITEIASSLLTTTDIESTFLKLYEASANYLMTPTLESVLIKIYDIMKTLISTTEMTATATINLQPVDITQILNAYTSMVSVADIPTAGFEPEFLYYIIYTTGKVMEYNILNSVTFTREIADLKNYGTIGGYVRKDMNHILIVESDTAISAYRKSDKYLEGYRMLDVRAVAVNNAMNRVVYKRDDDYLHIEDYDNNTGMMGGNAKAVAESRKFRWGNLKISKNDNIIQATFEKATFYDSNLDPIFSYTLNNANYAGVSDEDENGNFYTCDGGNYQITKFDSAGNIITQTNLQFVGSPIDLLVHSGKIYISTTYDTYIQIYDLDLNFLETVTINRGAYSIAKGKPGVIYGTQDYQSNFFEYDGNQVTYHSTDNHSMVMFTERE